MHIDFLITWGEHTCLPEEIAIDFGYCTREFECAGFKRIVDPNTDDFFSKGFLGCSYVAPARIL